VHDDVAKEKFLSCEKRLLLEHIAKKKYATNQIRFPVCPLRRTDQSPAVTDSRLIAAPECKA
jgi:hypothetical protein